MSETEKYQCARQLQLAAQLMQQAEPLTIKYLKKTTGPSPIIPSERTSGQKDVDSLKSKAKYSAQENELQSHATRLRALASGVAASSSSGAAASSSSGAAASAPSVKKKVKRDEPGKPIEIVYYKSNTWEALSKRNIYAQFVYYHKYTELSDTQNKRLTNEDLLAWADDNLDVVRTGFSAGAIARRRTAERATSARNKGIIGAAPKATAKYRTKFVPARRGSNIIQGNSS
jgi:hypothetical protein